LYLWKVPDLPLVRGSEVDAGRAAGPIDVDHLLGACMLIPRAAWEAIGPLDEGYFLFLEETDWCRRARGAGYRVCHLPAAEVLHHGEHSVHQVPVRSTVNYYRGLVRFARRGRLGAGQLAALKVVLALGAVVRLGLWTGRLMGSRRGLALGMLSGYARVLRELPGY